jgi:outer membrane biosynthesis protein TonB
MPVPELEREVQEALPPQLAQIVLEKKELPKLPPVIKKPEPEKIEQPPKPVEKKIEEPVKPVAEKVVPPKAEPSAERQRQQARDKAAVSGLLQFQDELADLRDEMDVARLKNAGLTRSEARASKVDRSVITGRSSKTSGGISSAALSQDTGGAALSGRETTQVSSELATTVARTRASNVAKLSGRSDEEIRKVMDRNKGAIFSIYNRALRKDPALAGKMTVQMVIEPSGQISAISVLASELNDPSLEQKLLARIRMIAFEARSVITTTLNYSFDFLPY